MTRTDQKLILEAYETIGTNNRGGHGPVNPPKSEGNGPWNNVYDNELVTKFVNSNPFENYKPHNYGKLGNIDSPSPTSRSLQRFSQTLNAMLAKGKTNIEDIARIAAELCGVKWATKFAEYYRQNVYDNELVTKFVESNPSKNFKPVSTGMGPYPTSSSLHSFSHILNAMLAKGETNIKDIARKAAGLCGVNWATKFAEYFKQHFKQQFKPQFKPQYRL